MHHNIRENHSVINGKLYTSFRMTLEENGKTVNKSWAFNESNREEVRAKVEALRQQLIKSNDDLFNITKGISRGCDVFRVCWTENGKFKRRELRFNNETYEAQRAKAEAFRIELKKRFYLC